MALTILANPDPFHGGVNQDAMEFHNLSRYGFFASASSSNPRYSQEPNRITGTPQDDIITFEWDDKLIYHNIHMWHRGVWAHGVTQRRLVSGELVAEAQRGNNFVRMCWTVADRIDGVSGDPALLLKETATGLVTISELSQEHSVEKWSITLYRADLFYCTHHDELEACYWADCGEHPRYGRNDRRYAFGDPGPT